jgi:2-polyprenyl-3-methyl-5-hydroxy-6-metoxy-1,4-benzoquinol methylase
MNSDNIYESISRRLLGARHHSERDEAEFDFQWKNLPSPTVEHADPRIDEFLNLTKFPRSFFLDKSCLDAGCGNGRWTWVMKELGARVTSFDISPAAVEACQRANQEAYVADIYALTENRIFDFVLSWGVLHHLPDPELGFRKVASQVKNGGTLHVMVYHKDTQKPYEEGRRAWPNLTASKRKAYCERMVRKHGGDVFGWWDALNPTYNYSYSPSEIEQWFETEGFTHVTLTQEYNINMRGIYQQ